jgi:Zn-dependent M16 (insulinase) family peptidase
LATILKHYLHELIRGELGAYSAQAIHEADDGLFFIESYRDSNVRGVLAAFANGLQQVADGIGLTDEAIELVVTRVFSRLDHPVSPQKRGMRYWNGRTREDVQNQRDVCYNLTKEQLANTARRVAEIEPVTIVFSSQTIGPAPADFTVIPLTTP